MSEINNMYIGGKATVKKWLQPGVDIRRTMASLWFPNANEPPAVGTTIELPTQYREFQPDLSAKNLKDVDFSSLKNATKEDITQAIQWVEDNIGWYHSINLPQGLVTPGSRGWEYRKKIFSIPQRVKGKTVLDLGAMEGGDSFCAEEAGATVTSYDVDHYFQYDLGLNAAWEFVVKKYLEAKSQGEEKEWIFLNSKRFGFELCKQLRKSQVNRLSGSIYDLNPEQHGQFDIVYCFGMFYHLRHPILALDKIYTVTKEMAFINNQIFTGYTPDAETILFFNDTWRGSYTNWFVPTPQAFINMASSIGWGKIEVVDINKNSISLICYK